VWHAMQGEDYVHTMYWEGRDEEGAANWLDKPSRWLDHACCDWERGASISLLPSCSRRKACTHKHAQGQTVHQVSVHMRATRSVATNEI